MKKNLVVLFSTVVLLIAGFSISRAAFPVAAPSATSTSMNNGSSSATAGDVNASYETAAPASMKATPTHPATGGGKSQIVALILCALIGGLGIHRFYLGYTWQGVVQLLTAGGCGVWALIDLIRIITGDLGPKGGRYAKTF
jgi:hypothetical protein